MSRLWTAIVKNEGGDVFAPVFHGEWDGKSAYKTALNQFSGIGAVVCVLAGVQTEGVYPTPTNSNLRGERS